MWFKRRSDEVETLRRRLDDCESKLRTLETEWLDTLDKMKRLAGRLAKRAEREDHDKPELNGHRQTIAGLRAAGRLPW